MDSQQSQKSSKSELAWWSLEVGIYPERNHLIIWILCGVQTPVWTYDRILMCGVPPYCPPVLCNVVGCPHLNCSPHQQRMCGVPPQVIIFLCFRRRRCLRIRKYQMDQIMCRKWAKQWFFYHYRQGKNILFKTIINTFYTILPHVLFIFNCHNTNSTKLKHNVT